MIRKLLLTLGFIVIAAAGYFVFAANTDSGAPGDVAHAAAGAPAPAKTGEKPASDAKGSGEFWTERCNKDGDKHCEVFQRLIVSKTNQRLVEFAVGFPPDAKGEPQAAILMPLGILLSEGVLLSVDGGTPARSAVRTCLPDACVVVMNLPAAFLEMMKKGKLLTVSFIDVGTGKQVNIEMALSGFGEKLAKLKR